MKEGGINLTARLNLFSMISPPYPMCREHVNSDFVVKVLLSWVEIFQLLFGSEPCLNCSVDDLISGSKIFEKLLVNIRSSTLRLLPANLILHKLADILFKWFSLVRLNFKSDNISYSFSSRISAALLLQSFMDNFEILPLDTIIYEAQAAKGKNLQCFLGRSEINNNSLGHSSKEDNKKGSGTRVCLAFVCKSYLNDFSNIFKCNLVNDVCVRAHLSKEEFKTNAKDVFNLIESLPYLPLAFKKDILDKLILFMESE
jgi:hypothetical protein